MTTDSDIIQLNGKRYDARTGHLLSIPHAKNTKKTEAKKIKVVHHDPSNNSEKPHIHHRTERAKTLMRQAVQKPTPVKQVEHKATASPPEIHRSRQAHLRVDPGRLERARQTTKSHLIKKFDTSKAATSIKFITTEIPVQPEPVEAPGPDEEWIPPSQAQTDQTQSIWQHAIDQANGHTQPRTKRSSHRHNLSRKLGVGTSIVNFGAIALSAILLVGFIAYQNIPNLSMQLAAKRAGIAGELPGYQPAGFGLSGPIHYRPGQITLNFQSHSDNRQFKIHQAASEWDDVTLLKEYLVPEHAAFQTRQTAGKTVYIYEDHNATWVENGIWYQVEGESSLSSEQLLQLAASM